MTSPTPAQKLLYTSKPYAFAQPSALSALAALHGAPTAPVETARVLELGCASGGNIIPLAARFPSASFTGIDLEDGAIAAGNARIGALGLANIRLEAADIVDFAERQQEFDYIICHGILSWVPAPVRDALFRICRTQLGPDGLAMISFNVLPGWRMEQIVRDICIHRMNVDANADPMARVAQGLATLNAVATGAEERTPYGFIVRQAAQRLAKLDPSYLLAEYFAPVNECFFFEDILRQAQQSGLYYVSDCELAAASPEVLIPSGAAAVRAQANNDPGRVQCYLDMASGRPFRRSIFSRRPASEAPQASKFQALHASLALTRAAAAPTRFHTRTGRQFNAQDETVADALGELASIYPGSGAISEIARDAKNRDALETSLMSLAISGHLLLYSTPLKVGRKIAPSPRVFSLARLEAQQNQKWLTNLQHHPVTPSPDAMSLLPHLDGSRARNTLAAILEGDDQATRVEDALSLLEHEALLMPEEAN